MIDISTATACTRQGLPRSDVYLAGGETALEDPVPVELHIHALTERLRVLKFELSSIQSKKNFLEWMLEGGEYSENEAQSMFQQQVEMEIAIEKEKTQNRAAKASRAEQEGLLPQAATEFAESLSQCEKSRQDLEQTVKHAYVRHQAKEALDIMESENLDAIETFIKQSKKLYSGPSAILGELLDDYKSTLLAERGLLQEKQNAVEDAWLKIKPESQRLDDELAELQSQIKERQQSSVNTQGLYQTLADQRLLEEFTKALTGVKITSISETELILKIDPEFEDVQNTNVDNGVHIEKLLNILNSSAAVNISRREGTISITSKDHQAMTGTQEGLMTELINSITNIVIESKKSANL